MLTSEQLHRAHHYYDTPPVTDLAAIRAEAQRRAFDKRKPEDSVIHLHPYDEDTICPPQGEHEYYVAEKGLVSNG